jgi:hypothetical protein
LTTRRTTAAAILPNLPQFVLIDESECDREMWFHGLDQRLGIILREGSAHAAVPAVPILRCQRGSPSAPRAGLQPRQLHAQAGAARGQVPDEFAGKLI